MMFQGMKYVFHNRKYFIGKIFSMDGYIHVQWFF